MLLTIDIGNTNITMGLYQGETLGPRWRLATLHGRMPDEYGLQFLGLLEHAGFQPKDIHGVCLASVVPPVTSKVLEACQRYLGQDPLVVDAGVKTGVRIRYEDPRAVGADRIVDAAAVLHFYGTPACVVDFGTATTFDAISRQGDYLGGPSRRAFTSPPKPFFCIPPNCLAWTFNVPPAPSGATRYTPCNPACSSAMSPWWRAWWSVSARNWVRI